MLVAMTTEDNFYSSDHSLVGNYLISSIHITHLLQSTFGFIFE